MWRAYRDHGTLPRAGGWMDQPLDLLVKINAISLMVDTLKMQHDGTDWGLLTATQREFLRWMDG